jgi:hypothetical protein
MNRRSFLASIGSATLASCTYWPEDGIQNPCLSPSLPDDLARSEVVQSAWEGIDPTQYWDCHVHLLGTGDSGSGIWINSDMQSLLHPIQFAQFKFYMNAACIKDPEHVDDDYVGRLVAYQSGLPTGNRVMLLAFDYHYNERGERQPDMSTFHIPNAYAAQVAKSFPNHVEWIASIHPYRSDCVEALHDAVSQGARAVKWLPPAMGMDPASPLCASPFILGFYQG